MGAVILATVAASAALAGCLDFLEGEGSESLVIRNNDIQPVNVILRIVHEESGLAVFNQEVVLNVGEADEFVVPMRPGIHRVFLTTTNGLSEIFPIEVPAKGDSRFELTVFRGRATLTQRS